jgi:hypothetical protein
MKAGKVRKAGRASRLSPCPLARPLNARNTKAAVADIAANNDPTRKAANELNAKSPLESND